MEALPTDADGKTHTVKVEVTRPKASVRAPAEIAAARRSTDTSVEAVTRALAQPTDIAEIPFEVATYVTHADEPGKVRVIVSATVPESPGFVPAEWGYLILDAGKVLGGSREQITETSSRRWVASASLAVPAGRYRIRAALVAADGRVATARSSVAGRPAGGRRRAGERSDCRGAERGASGTARASPSG